MSQIFYTARELAALAAQHKVLSFPQTESAVIRRAKKDGWNELPANLCRKRAGRVGGGGREYHLSVLPDVMQMVLNRDAIKASMVEAHGTKVQIAERKIATASTLSMTARQRLVMEARAEILTAIDGYAVAHGHKRARSIALFLAAQDQLAARQDIEAKRDSGGILTEDEINILAAPSVLAVEFQLPAARIALANDRKASPTVKRSSLYEWFKARDMQGVTALAPIPPKLAQPIPAGFAEFFKFYAIPTKPSIADAFLEYQKSAAQKQGVQKMTLTISQAEYILRHRMNNIEKKVGREGLLTLRSRLAYVTRTTDDMWPTTIYSADGKTFDAEIADIGTRLPIRPEITTIIDIVTRKVVGISLARSENQRSVAEALRNACCACGIPAIFYVDRGPGYRNEAMDADVGGLMGRLGITKMHAAPYGSQAKGRIERPNATIWDTLAKRLPTYIGKDMDKEAGDKIHKITRREIKEFGFSRHLPSWEQFVSLCEAMVVEYNNKVHTGLPRFEDPETGKLRHMTPNEAWAAHVAAGFEPVPVDPGEVDDLFRPYEVRTVRRAQVQWNTNFFFDHALEAYHMEKVMVGYDYHQADRVWVREFSRETGQPGKLICVARFMGNAERYVPLSYEQNAIETRAKGRLDRVDKKRDAIEAEREVRLALEHMPSAPLPDFSPSPMIDAVPLSIVGADDAVVQAPRRRVFASDEALAVWALENPGELSPNQIRVLAGCLKDATSRKLFELSGIDTEALRTLLRAAA